MRETLNPWKWIHLRYRLLRVLFNDVAALSLIYNRDIMNVDRHVLQYIANETAIRKGRTASYWGPKIQTNGARAAWLSII